MSLAIEMKLLNFSIIEQKISFANLLLYIFDFINLNHFLDSESLPQLMFVTFLDIFLYFKTI